MQAVCDGTKNTAQNAVRSVTPVTPKTNTVLAYFNQATAYALLATITCVYDLR